MIGFFCAYASLYREPVDQLKAYLRQGHTTGRRLNIVPVGVLQDVKGAARGVTPQQGRCQHLVTWACTCGLLSVHCILPAQAGNNNAPITLRYNHKFLYFPVADTL